MLLSLNPGKIEYYTSYRRQVLPTRRKMVRMGLEPSMEEDSQWKRYLNLKGYKNRMVSQGRLPEWKDY
jgi:hypothetical protein